MALTLTSLGYHPSEERNSHDHNSMSKIPSDGKTKGSKEGKVEDFQIKTEFSTSQKT